MITEIGFEHDHYITEDLMGTRQDIPRSTTVNVSMVFHGDAIVEALAHVQVNNMGEHEGLLFIADAVARRDGIGSHFHTPEPTPAPAQRQPTGKRNIDLG